VAVITSFKDNSTYCSHDIVMAQDCPPVRTITRCCPDFSTHTLPLGNRGAQPLPLPPHLCKGCSIFSAPTRPIDGTGIALRDHCPLNPAPVPRYPARHSHFQHRKKSSRAPLLLLPYIPLECPNTLLTILWHAGQVFAWLCASLR
jgi:hypothetical protein